MNGPSSIVAHVPLTIRRRPGRKTIVTPESTSSPLSLPARRRRTDPAMVKALARAYRWRCMLATGGCASISEIAAKEKIDRGFVGTILRLTLLAPDIVEAILDGRQPVGLGLPRLLKPFPIEWDRQRDELSR